MPPALVCTPWLDITDVSLCEPATFAEGRLQRALDAATDLLFLALGRQQLGACTDAIRPCSSSAAVQWLDYPSGGARPLMTDACGCGGPDAGWCACGAHASIELPNGPVIAIESVTIHGETLDPSAYRIVDDRFLVRTDGSAWPCCQRPLDPSEPNTFQIVYQWGAALSPAVLLAVEVLACELATSWAGGSCRLPRRLTSLVRENVQMTILDPFDFLDDGRFGLYEVDAVIGQFNPHGLDRPPAILSPESIARRPRRLR